MRIRSLTPVRIGLFALAFAFFAPLAFGQMPQGNQKTLSSEDVSDEELQKAAQIAVKAQMSTQKDRMKMRKDMKKKYGNPQEMDSTEKAKMRRDVRKKRMAMQKKMKKVMQKEAKKEDMDPQRVNLILQSTQQDAELKKRFKKAMKSAVMEQRSNMGGKKKGGGGSSNR
jgi:hypothetical protein